MHMKTQITTLNHIVGLLTLFLIGPAVQAQTSSLTASKYNTIAHRLLWKELALHLKGADTLGTPLEYANFLDGLIDSTASRVSSVTRERGKAIDLQDSTDAIMVLSAIDAILCDAHVVVCIRLQLVSDGLWKRNPEKFPCEIRRCGKEWFPSLSKGDDWRGLDCDLAAIVYVGIGEALGYPIRMVEVPEHSFVRWHFSPAQYLNWDNNSATILTDDQFRHEGSPTSRHPFTKQDEERLHYLESMSDSTVVQYHTLMMAIALGNEKRLEEAETLYLKTLEVCPYAALALNNLAWMYVTEASMSDKGRTADALSYATRADSLDVNNIEYRDTYSCVCAANAQFELAIQIENRARRKPTRLAAYAQRRTCLDIGEQ